MKVAIYYILEMVSYIALVIALLTDSIEYVAVMVSFIALFSVRRLEAKLEEDK